MARPENDSDHLTRRSDQPADGQSPAGGSTDRPPPDRDLIDQLPAIVFRIEPSTGRFTFISDYATSLLGYPSQRWTDEATSWQDLIYPEDRESVILQRDSAMKAGGSYDVEYRMIAADGRVLWVSEHGHVVPDGNRGGLVGIIVGLSLGRSLNETLSTSKLWLREAIDQIPQQLWSALADGTLDFCNARWCSELGLSLDELQAHPWPEMLHPDDRDRVLKAWHESVANGTPFEEQERLRVNDGQYRWFLCRSVPMRDEQGRVARWLGTNTDIESQKQAEDGLRKSEQRWRAVFDNAWVGIALTYSSLSFVAANDAFQRMVGYSLEELRTMTVLDLIHEDDRGECQVLNDELRSGIRNTFELEERVLHKDGRLLWVRVNGSVLPTPPGETTLWVWIVEDITERKRLHDELERKRNRLLLLLDLIQQFIAKLDVESFVDVVLARLCERDRWDAAAVFLPEGSDWLKVYQRRGAARYPLESTSLPIEGSAAGTVYRSGKPYVFRFEDLPALFAMYDKEPWLRDIFQTEHLKDGCALPLVHSANVLGVLFLASRTPRDLPVGEVDDLQELARFIAASLSNALRYDDLTAAYERLTKAKDQLEEQIRVEFDSGHIVGRSKALRDVLHQAYSVAPTDSAVLILGETGTGKELIARAIHDHSARRDQPFVKIDSSAIPATLLESELFGHERGAFTGAISRKLGRLEVADKGTLFLDEIGDLPFELQAKLLRVLQDQTFERLGSNRALRLDIRVIAATNHDLEDMVAKGKFRADLYYRLKVFPITIPPLRERREDIEPLVRHYVRKYSQRLKKEINTIPADAMAVFKRYPWPGNVRELQHFMERAVVLTSGKTLRVPLHGLEQIIRLKQVSAAPSATSRTMEEIERDAILHALRDSNWVVGGPQGAAKKLGLKRTTLASRMERLGISRRP
jgi:formate hydrogenlyase transcriptional activator